MVCIVIVLQRFGISKFQSIAILTAKLIATLPSIVKSKKILQKV